MIVPFKTDYKENIKPKVVLVKNKEGIKDENNSMKEKDLYAKSAVLLDADSNRVLYNKNGDQVLPMASTTKIMTCIVVLENSKPDEIVKVSQYASSMPDVQLNIKEGEKYYIKDLLYSLMLESHNDTAVALAEHVGGTVEGFADLMNKKAKEIGCKHTYFITPNGLDKTDKNGTHSTTGIDLARIMSYCIKKSPKSKEFLKITREPNYSFASVDGKRSFTCTNHNAFLRMMDGALSGKTGFTNDAGYCYVGSLRKDKKTFVVALLACGWPNNRTYKWKDTKKLMNYGLSNYDYKKFQDMKLDKKELKPVIVKNGQTKEIDDIATTNVRVIENKKQKKDNKAGILLKKDENVEIRYDIKDEVEAPIEEGDKVGTVEYLVDEKVWKTCSVVAMNGVNKIDFEWCYKKVMRKFLIGNFI
ncbi:D-alanyl-D-alanine carboxypeptidase [Anaerosacchariphilus polymeriproducens]|uniref:serine-type D-Ala-D-Ala carboxypeptidase n=2 Tax=Anaerosacchariphilus polymeriproducens TaxID=1812858 RepID=A0A371AUD6_9FIRM|nr:D-alanyl-D-alanine carboxypeptidase [Anaerosacchariphilus polymeriproducens]